MFSPQRVSWCRYKREEILGRNCRFLQGPGTDRRAVKEIRSAIDNGQECTVRLINYTKSGQPFWNMFSLAPVFGQDGKVRYFVGVQVDVSAKDMSMPSCASRLRRPVRVAGACSERR